MFKEVLQIIPQLSAADLAKMEKALGDRFKDIAKKFGKGLFESLKGGGYAAAAIALVDKLINPLKEIQAQIDQTLAHGSDLTVQAKQFNTSAGELAKLQAFGQAKGIGPDQVNLLVEKFQTAVSQAVADPGKNTSVRNFTGEKNTVQAFFDFVQGLQKLGKNQQIQVQEEVFGSKQILKMSEFLNADFSKLSDEFKGVSPEKVTAAAEKTSSLEDLKQTLGSVRELNDFVAKSGKINENMIILRNEQEKRLAEIDNKRIASYESLAQIEAASTEIVDIAKSGILALTSMVVKITDLSANIKKITGSRFIRGILGQGGKDE